MLRIVPCEVPGKKYGARRCSRMASLLFIREGIERMTKVKELVVRVVILFLGLTIAHLGVTLFLLADLGSDPFNVLIQGIFRSISKVADWSFITHGRVHIVVSLLIVCVLLFVDKSYIKIGTLLCMICGGPIIDFFTRILDPVFAGDLSLAVRIVVNIIGCCILAFGMTIVIKSEAGTGPNDLVAVVISEKLEKKFSITRIIVDVCYAGIGFLLSGTVGIGTIICAFVVGPIAGIFMPINEGWIRKAVEKICSAL